MSSFITKRANEALNANPNVFNYPAASDINITTRGSDVYWAVCAIMTVSSFVFIGLSFTIARPKRIFHYITAAITMVAAIAYFTMASNLGYAAIPVEFVRTRPNVAGFTREIFYVRYIDWFVTTPVSIAIISSICVAMLIICSSFSSISCLLLVSHGQPFSTPSSSTRS